MPTLKWTTYVALFATFALLPQALSAKDGEGSSASTAEVAKQLMNPNTSLANLTFRNQYRWYDGDLPGADKQDNFTFLFQPVFPLVLGQTAEGAQRKLFIRPAIPIQVDQPYPEAKAGGLEWDDASGLGDIGFDVAYGLSWPNGNQFAAGVVGSLPTATGDVPGGNTTLGPEIFVGHAGSFGFVGGLLTHQWDIDSWSDSDVSKTTLQTFITFGLPNGWAVGTIPIMSYDWKNDEATVPLNAYIQKTLKIGNTPTRIQLEVNYYPDSWRPDAFGPEWFIALNFTPAVSNPFQRFVDN